MIRVHIVIWTVLSFILSLNAGDEFTALVITVEEIAPISINNTITSGGAPTPPVPPGSSPQVVRPPGLGALLVTSAGATYGKFGGLSSTVLQTDELAEPLAEETRAVSLVIDWGENNDEETTVDPDVPVHRIRQLDLEGGAYRFYIWGEGGIRFWVNDRPVVDRWIGGEPAVAIGHVWLDRSGPVEVMLSYDPVGPSDHVKIRWERVTYFHSWQAAYFPNRYLTGQPLMVRDDPEIYFDWGQDAPVLGMPADDFSVRWNRTLWLPASCYRISVRADNGVRVYVDDTLLINTWNGSTAEDDFHRDIALTEGEHEFIVEYYNRQGPSHIAIEWDAIGPLAEQGANQDGLACQDTSTLELAHSAPNSRSPIDMFRELLAQAMQYLRDKVPTRQYE